MGLGAHTSHELGLGSVLDSGSGLGAGLGLGLGLWSGLRLGKALRAWASMLDPSVMSNDASIRVGSVTGLHSASAVAA